jgi:hypothetical protein
MPCDPKILEDGLKRAIRGRKPNFSPDRKRLEAAHAMKLPKPIDTYIQAINAGDAAAFAVKLRRSGRRQ